MLPRVCQIKGKGLRSDLNVFKMCNYNKLQIPTDWVHPDIHGYSPPFSKCVIFRFSSRVNLRVYYLLILPLNFFECNQGE